MKTLIDEIPKGQAQMVQLMPTTDEELAVAVAEAVGAWLTRPEVAERLKIPPKTLAEWASQKKGPPFTKIGRFSRYRLSEVIAWEQRQATGGGGA